jgi:hypothetical protein
MPTLDVSDAFDPSFWDDIVVVRRYTYMDEKGRVQVSERPISTRGVVVASSPNDLMRVPESEMMNKSISITSPFRFQGPATDEVGTVTHPDHVLWNNSMYVVRALDDYSGYGRGFVHVVCTSIQNADYPPKPGPDLIPTPIGNA